MPKSANENTTATNTPHVLGCMASTPGSPQRRCCRSRDCCTGCKVLQPEHRLGASLVTASKNPEQTRGRPFEPGNPGGPGRPQGSRNKATLALDKIADDAGEEILNAMVGAAKGGDMRAAELVLQRIWPARKSRPIALTLPAIQSAFDVVAAVGAVADAVGAGEITPDEGQAVASILEAKRRAIETVDLESRLSALEQERK